MGSYSEITVIIRFKHFTPWKFSTRRGILSHKEAQKAQKYFLTTSLRQSATPWQANLSLTRDTKAGCGRNQNPKFEILNKLGINEISNVSNIVLRISLFIVSSLFRISSLVLRISRIKSLGVVPSDLTIRKVGRHGGCGL